MTTPILKLQIYGFLLVLLIGPYQSIIVHTTSTSSNSYLSVATNGTSTWEVLNHDYMNPEAFPRDIEFFNSSHGWVVSQNESFTSHGIILHTRDGGDSWQLQHYNASQLYSTIFIIDGENLWVTGRGGLCHTKDGGQTWNMTVIGGLIELFYGLYFINRTHGWTASNDNMYRTTDEGTSWQIVDSWIFDDDWARDICFVTQSEGWVIGFYGIYHTKDQGDSWDKVFDKGGWSLSFVSETEAWAVADTWLTHMTDGETWVEQPLPRVSLFPHQNHPYYSDIQFFDSNHGWIAGDETKVVYTPNGGLDWYAQEFPNDNRVTAIDFINLTHGWAVGSGGSIYRTINGNSLGSRLWTGVTDPIFLLIVGSFVTVIIVLTGCVFFWRKKRKRVTGMKGLADGPSVNLE